MKQICLRCYNRNTFIACYSFSMRPVPGEKFWDKNFQGKIEPPELRQKGAGKRQKKRVLEDWETMKGKRKLPRKGLKQACTECHRFGHNSRTCALKKAKAVMKQANPGHSIDTYFDEQQCRFVLNNNPGQPSLLAATISDQNRASGSTMSAIARVGSPDVVTSPKRRGRGRGIGCGIVISTQESQASS